MQLDSVLLKFHMLHHFWFLLCKLLKDEGLLAVELPENTHSELRMPKFSSQGGFLKQPDFSSLPENVIENAANVEQRRKEKFGCLLCEMAWQIFCRCLVNGKNFIDYNLCQVLSGLRFPWLFGLFSFFEIVCYLKDHLAFYFSSFFNFFII